MRKKAPREEKKFRHEEKAPHKEKKSLKREKCPPPPKGQTLTPCPGCPFTIFFYCMYIKIISSIPIFTVTFFHFRCHRCSKELSIREESFFAKANLSLVQILDNMYRYSYEAASYKTLSHEIGIESEAICNWRNYVRDIYGEHFVRNPVALSQLLYDASTMYKCARNGCLEA